MSFKNLFVVALTLVAFNFSAQAHKPAPQFPNTSILLERELTPEQIMRELEYQDNSMNIMKGTANIVSRSGTGESVVIEVYKAPRGFGISKEFITVTYNGRLEYAFLTSTARAGKHTPSGTWSGLQRMHEEWTSAIYNVRMDYAMFFSGPFAVHSTTLSSYSLLGKPASAGCIRLARPNARKLFRLVQKTGTRNLKVIVYSSGAQPAHSNIKQIEKMLQDDEQQIRQLIRNRTSG